MRESSSRRRQKFARRALAAAERIRRDRGSWGRCSCVRPDEPSGGKCSRCFGTVAA
jgi:hypothetical protein